MNTKEISNKLIQGVIGAIIGWLLASITPQQTKDWALLIGLLVITVILGVITFEISQVHRNIVKPVPKVTLYGLDSPDRTKLYAPVTETVSRAKKRIAVVTYHAFSPSPSEAATNRYYDAIDNLLDQKIKDRQKFFYTRIYQLPQDAVFDENRLGTRDFAHFQKYHSHDNSSSSVQINFLRVTTSIHSAILVVDDSDIFIGIPQTTPRGVIISSVIHVHDETGNSLQDIEKLLTTAQGEAEPIRVAKAKAG
jgi:hypothetical protein